MAPMTVEMKIKFILLSNGTVGPSVVGPVPLPWLPGPGLGCACSLLPTDTVIRNAAINVIFFMLVIFNLLIQVAPNIMRPGKKGYLIL